MKKILVLMLAIVLVMTAFAGCGSGNDTNSEDLVGPGTENPVVESDAATIMQTLGVEFAIPEGSSDVSYAIINGETAQMLFYDEAGTQFMARIKSTADFEDISGYYYNWTSEGEKDKVGYCDAELKSYVSEDETGIDNDAQLILWYDKVPGLMYSLAAEGKDLNGLDIAVKAAQVYIQTQGDVDGDVQPEA
mgnify:FL=1